MSNVFRLLTHSYPFLDRFEIVSVWITTILSVLIFLGYLCIVFNWYFQMRLDRKRSAKSLRQLRQITAVCAICAFTFGTIEMPQIGWQLYNVVLFAGVCYIWTTIFISRGSSLLTDLEASAAKYREIAELLPNICWTATEKGKIDYSNQRWQEYSFNSDWSSAVHPLDQEALEDWRGAVASRQSFAKEVRLLGKDGYKTFLIKANPFPEGEAVKWIGMCVDIEAQKQLAAERDQQIKQKTFFVNSLSHDLRSPLNSIVLNAHIFKLMPNDPPDQEAVDMIIESATAAADLLSRLLDYAKAGREELLLGTVDIGATLVNLQRRYHSIVAQTELTFKVSIEEELICVTDKLKLERIIANLIDNAIKYTPNKGTIELSADKTGNQISIFVKDTGPGIPQEHIPRLFDEFFQVNNNERDRRKGFGLGLAICKFLARQIGGDVRLASSDEHGSVFEITLQRDSFNCGRPPGIPNGTGEDIEVRQLCHFGS